VFATCVVVERLAGHAFSWHRACEYRNELRDELRLQCTYCKSTNDHLNQLSALCYLLVSSMTIKHGSSGPALAWIAIVGNMPLPVLALSVCQCDAAVCPELEGYCCKSRFAQGIKIFGGRWCVFRLKI
jgi:hypothetical protein